MDSCFQPRSQGQGKGPGTRLLLFRPSWTKQLFRFVRFCILTPRNTCRGNACFGEQVGSKYGTLYSELVILQFMCVAVLLGWRYTFSLHSADESQETRPCSPLFVLKNRYTMSTCIYSFCSYDRLRYISKV